MDNFDYKNPDYAAIYKKRAGWLKMLRQDPVLLRDVKRYYKDNPAQFICDWGVTIDPKNVERGLPSVIPFLLFPKQIEWVNEVVAHWKASKPMLTEKTRQMGFSWLSVATACTLCLFNDGMSIGFGSRKEEYVDKIGDPKSLFHKAREFIKYLPVEFRGGWVEGAHSPHMRISFPNTGASITGEAGDNIGRGNTTSIYFVDEAAFLERPMLVEASLSQTTNCRIDISTPNGLGNPFAEKRFSGKIDVFTFHWRDDPRKDDAWYEKQKNELDPVTVAQEIDIDYAASVEGVVIPSAWIQSAIDAHVKLGVTPSGAFIGSLDVADEGADKNALCIRHGIELLHIEEWSGKDKTIFHTTARAIESALAYNIDHLRYDGDGMGSSVRGDAQEINNQRRAAGKKIANAVMFRGSGAVVKPESQMVKGRLNKDFFQNLKSQSWWNLRLRFEKTHNAIVSGLNYDLDEIISLPSGTPNLNKLIIELSQPTWSINNIGKVVIDKQPDGVKSPNLADAVMMAFAPLQTGLRINADELNKI